MRLHSRLKYWIGCIPLAFGLTAIGFAQESAHLHEPLARGIDRITEASVTGTVTFLASDELAGRGTGSREFDIAAAYVASRFMAAGLSGAGDGGSFYHETLFPLKYYPAGETVSLRGSEESKSSKIPILGVLGASHSAVSYSGPLTEVDLAQIDSLKAISHFAVAQWENTTKGARALSQLARAAQHLEAAGAKGLILRATPDSEWVKLAKERDGMPRIEGRSDINIPILVVALEQTLPEQLTIEVPATKVVNHRMRNVIGALPGSSTELAKEAVLYSAHLDHLGSVHQDGDNIYNGADDDASGVTGVLTLADAFGASARPRRTLLFMTFWGEEAGLLGSQAFVDRPSWPLDSIVANVNIEMIGRPENGAHGKTWVTGWGESNLGPLTREAAAFKGFEIFEHPQFSAMLYKSSDNWSFAQRGVIAHSFAAGSLHADYHQVDDEVDRLELKHMTQVIRGLFYGTLPLANGEVTPVASKKATK